MHFYTDPANFMSYESSEGGYLGNVYNGSELLDEQIELDINDTDLYNDIHESLDPTTAWANEYEYYNSEADFKMEQWEDFKDVVKSNSRFMLLAKQVFNIGSKTIDVKRTLDNIGKMAKQLNMVKVLPIGTILYRCRQHVLQNEVKKFEHIISPPDDKAMFPNRMSPAGISMFYAAFDFDTSYKETIDSVGGKYYTSAEFRNRRNLNILDLSSKIMPSIFDQMKWKNYYTISFLNSFISDFTKSIVKDGRIHVEYVPTQIVTEYFRYVFKFGKKSVDGIIYPSSKNKGRNACVLFFNHNDCQVELEMIPNSLKTKKIKP